MHACSVDCNSPRLTPYCSSTRRCAFAEQESASKVRATSAHSAEQRISFVAAGVPMCERPQRSKMRVTWARQCLRRRREGEGDAHAW
eukprot:2802006-Pleurochrysis_carterae.AAC.1